MLSNTHTSMSPCSQTLILPCLHALKHSYFHVSMLSNTHTFMSPCSQTLILPCLHVPIPREAVDDARLGLERRVDQRNDVLCDLLWFLWNHGISEICPIETLSKPVSVKFNIVTAKILHGSCGKFSRYNKILHSGIKFCVGRLV